jgi:hypothetical protein
MKPLIFKSENNKIIVSSESKKPDGQINKNNIKKN